MYHQLLKKNPSVQYSKISTLSKDSTDEDYLLSNLSRMCEQIHEIVMKNGKLFRSVGIQFVQNDMTGKSRSRMLLHPTASLREFANISDLRSIIMSDKIHTDAEDILQELQNKNKQKVNNSCGCSHEEPESVAQTQSEGSCGCSHEEPSHGHEHSSASLIKPESISQTQSGGSCGCSNTK